MFKFITGKPLWVNILVAVLFTFLLIFLFLQSLEYFTNHGKVIKIPSVITKDYEEAIRLLENQGFDVEIQDSVYVDSLPGRVVVKQFPEPEVLVKVNRTIYLTVNRVIPPMVEMPNLINMSYRSADDNLRSFGLKMGDTSYQPDFAKNAVIHQRYNGTDIKPGTKIPMGSTISLVFGSGISNEEIAVPDLFGLTLQEAEMLLSVSGLRTGAVVKDANVSDSLNAYIYKQSPERLDYDKRVNRIRPGQLIDVWLSRDKPVRPDPPSQIPGEEPSN